MFHYSQSKSTDFLNEKLSERTNEPFEVVRIYFLILEFVQDFYQELNFVFVDLYL